MEIFEGKKEIRQNTLFCIHDNAQNLKQEVNSASFIFHDLIQGSLRENKEVIFLCVGSDRSVGDSLGPLVGSMLQENEVPYRIYGTLEEPVHAFNLERTIKVIKKQFRQPFIISIDAGLGEKEQVGAVLLKEGPLLPGQALKKMLPAVGDYHITGIVNYLDPLPAAQFLNDTRLHTVMKLAKTIVHVITNE